MKRLIKTSCALFVVVICLATIIGGYLIWRPESVSYTPPKTLLSRANITEISLLETWELVTYVDFSPDGEWIIVVYSEGVGLVDTDSGQQQHFFRHLSPFQFLTCDFICPNVDGAAINTDKDVLVSVDNAWEGGTSRMKLWDINDGHLIKTVEEEDTFINLLGFSYDGTLWAYQRGNALYVENLNSGKEETDFPVSGSVRTFAFSPTEPLLAYSSFPGIYLQHYETDEPALQIGDQNNLSILQFSHDGNMLIGWDYDNYGEDMVVLVDVHAAELVELALDDGSDVGNVVFSPDGAQLAIVDVGDTPNVQIWDTATGEKVLTIPAAGDWGRVSASFSPDGTMLAMIRSKDDFLLIIDSEDGSILYSRHFRDLIDVQFSPKGDLLVIRTAEDIQLWGIKG